MRDEPLADDQLGGAGLVLVRRDRRRCVVHPYPAGEQTERLERPVQSMVSSSLGSKTRAQDAYSRNSSWDTPSWFSSVRGFPEKSRENFLSKSIRSCAYLRRSNSYCPHYDQRDTAGLARVLTVFSSEISAQPLSTCASFHAAGGQLSVCYGIPEGHITDPNCEYRSCLHSCPVLCTL